jgi:hypothetical protein
MKSRLLRAGTEIETKNTKYFLIKAGFLKNLYIRHFDRWRTTLNSCRRTKILIFRIDQLLMF